MVFLKSIASRIVTGLVIVAFFSHSLLVGHAQKVSDLSVEVYLPAPNVTLTALNNTDLQIGWDWDFIASGYAPPPVIEVQVDISTDGLNFTDLVVANASDFVVTYPGVPQGQYYARVRIIDGVHDVDYVTGPVSLSSGSGRRSRGESSGAEGGAAPVAENLVDVSISGLSYPGPTSVVVMTRDGAFETIIEPDSFGFFDSFISQLPEGEAVFSFSAQDVRGDLSRVVEFQADLQAPNFSLTEVFIPPVVRLERTLLYQGERVQVSGYAYRSGEVSLLLDGVTSVAGLTQANEEGYWEFAFLTDGLDPGTYRITATASSQDGLVDSPESNTVTFELASLLESAPVCGDGILDDGEQCDDGNTDVGDGCDVFCQAEGLLPETAIQQPDPAVMDDDSVTLAYEVLEEPNGVVESVRVYYSRNGGSFQLYPAVFEEGSIVLEDLDDGEYAVYSIGRDAGGYQEAAPLEPDATFSIDLVADVDVLAYPEKRFPTTGNWGLDFNLRLYPPGSTTAAQEYDATLDDEGWTNIDLDSEFEPSSYHALIKGESHLSRRLDDVDMSQLAGLTLDFTEDGTVFLKAGDVHPDKDDFVNSMDISAMLGWVYTNEIVMDLNRDGIVNAIDLSILMANLYQRGDGIQ